MAENREVIKRGRRDLWGVEVQGVVEPGRGGPREVGGAEQETGEDIKEVKGEILDLIRGRMEGLRKCVCGGGLVYRRKEEGRH